MPGICYFLLWHSLLFRPGCLKIFKRGNIYVLVFFYLLLLIPIALYAYHTTIRSSCSYEILDEAVSPDKSHNLVIYKESCSLFDSTSIKGSILTLDEILEFHYGYIFKIDPKSLKLDAGGKQDSIDAAWKSPANLSIYIDKDVEVKDKDTSYEGINIEYMNKRM